MTPLRLRMIEDMQIRNLAPQTQATYIDQIARFARHFGRSPELLGPPEVRAWQLYLAREKRLAASSISVAVAALRFLYTVTLRRTWAVEDDIPTVRQPRKLPEVLSPEEVRTFLQAVSSLKHRVILTVCYAAGLRVSEAVRLKATAIDSPRMVIRICIAWCPGAGSHQMANAGSPVGRASSSPSGCCRACSGGCSCASWSMRSPPAP